MNAREATIQAMEVLGDAASRMGAMAGLSGPVGWGFKGASAALKTIARVLTERDDAIEEIIARIKAPRSLRLPWHDRPEPVDPLEDTSPQVPHAKKDV